MPLICLPLTYVEILVVVVAVSLTFSKVLLPMAVVLEIGPFLLVGAHEDAVAVTDISSIDKYFTFVVISITISIFSHYSILSSRRIIHHIATILVHILAIMVEVVVTIPLHAVVVLVVIVVMVAVGTKVHAFCITTSSIAPTHVEPRTTLICGKAAPLQGLSSKLISLAAYTQISHSP